MSAQFVISEKGGKGKGTSEKKLGLIIQKIDLPQYFLILHCREFVS